MDIRKSHWNNSESSMALAFPIAKVNREKRTVSGFASLDNIDRHGDIVTAEASKKAFENFRGNIREMHQPTAVGKMLDFSEDSFFDKESGKKYSGVYVTAYISKGAQDTWEKVLDGTLTGFSIGGNIVDAKMEKAADGTGEDRRVIHNYDLHELSLVDSPANPLANIFSIQKTETGNIYKGIVANVPTENVFWCKSDEIVATSSQEGKDCVVCGTNMSNIGWVEQTEIEKFESVQKVLDSYLRKDDAPTSSHGALQTSAPHNVVDSEIAINTYPDQNEGKKVSPINLDRVTVKKNEGGNEMTEETTTTTEEVIEKSVDVETSATAETVNEASDLTGEAIEKAVAISEVEDTLDFTKMVGDLKTFFNESIEKNYATHAATAEDVKRMVEETRAQMGKAIDDIKAKQEEIAKSVTEMYGKIDYLDNRIGGFESATAVKKSSDLNGSMEDTKIQKTSIWQGTFLGVNSLTK